MADEVSPKVGMTYQFDSSLTKASQAKLQRTEYDYILQGYGDESSRPKVDQMNNEDSDLPDLDRWGQYYCRYCNL